MIKFDDAYRVTEKPPLFCGRCGNSLVDTVLTDGYNVRTGEQIIKRVLTCSTLSSTHDSWEPEIVFQEIGHLEPHWDWNKR